MSPHLCPWWGGYFIDNRLRRLLHNPDKILAPYVRSGMRAMDFGCGMGMFAIAMARLVGAEGRVVAVDLQQQMLDVLSKRAEKAGVGDRIDTHRCEANAMNLSATFDFALAFYSAHETPDQKRLLVDIHDCLEPGGRLLVVEPIGHVTRGAFETMVSQAAEAGLIEEARPRVRLSRAVLMVNTH